MQKLTNIKRAMKGISPVISVLLMIAIAVAASLVAYAWVSGYMDFTTTKVETTIQIQSVTEYAVYVQNIGKSDAELVDLYVDTKLESWSSISVDGVSGQTVIAPGQTAIISLSSPLPRSGNQATIKIVTADGKSAERTETFSGASTASSSLPTFTISASAGIGGTINPSGSIFVTQGNDRTFSINPASSYQILDVVVDGSSVGAVTSYTFTNVVADHTISVTFEETASVTYTITATAGTGGSINPSGSITVTEGNDQTFTITPSSNYHVVDVVVDGTSVGATTSHTFDNVDQDHTISATFEQNAPGTFTITASAGANGNINPSGSVAVSSGNDQSFTITPDSNYQVADVMVDGTSIGAATSYTFTNVVADHTISATFEQIPSQTLVLLPVGAGDSTENWNNGDWSLSNWECVDDTTPDETYVYDSFQSSGYSTDTYAADNHGSETGTIQSVTVHIMARQDRSGGNSDQSTARIALKIGSTTYYGNEEDLTSSWGEYTQTFTTNPAGGSWAENWNTIDSMQIGVSLLSADTIDDANGTSYAQCTQVWVEITYTPTP